MAQSDVTADVSAAGVATDTLWELAELAEQTLALADLYKPVRGVVRDRPVLSGLLAGALFGLVVGAVWRPRRSYFR
jgi:hypothetical protein